MAAKMKRTNENEESKRVKCRKGWCGRGSGRRRKMKKNVEEEETRRKKRRRTKRE